MARREHGTAATDATCPSDIHTQALNVSMGAAEAACDERFFEPAVTPNQNSKCPRHGAAWTSLIECSRGGGIRKIWQNGSHRASSFEAFFVACLLSIRFGATPPYFPLYLARVFV